eukprot:TRINITY_DN208_c0_g1_i1.p1 TRINITY_DN208_c0_g1~~TRINITY_DN208_c0_g1_i1.p1  ORF type:complete len:344 (-),score=81.75 TRINITY_DN208_c0_g1_i1:347-1378(-)
MCAGLQISGGWLRFYGAYSNRFTSLVAGSIIGALGQPFLDAAPTVLVGNWFGDQERTTAVSLFCMFGWNGSMALCLWLIPTMVDSPAMLWNFLLFTASVCTVVGIANLLIQEEKAPTPPSAAASAEKAPEFIKSFVAIFKDRNFVFLLISWGCTLGILQFYFLSAGVLWQPTFSQSETGQIVAAAGAAGLFSTFGMGRLVDKMRNYKPALLIASAGTSGALLILGFVHEDFLFWAVVVFSAIFGIFALATYPTALEYGTELTFPISEQFSAATLVIGADIWTVIIAYLVAWEVDEFNHRVGVFTLCGLMAAVTACTFFIKPNYKRLEFEKSQNSEQQQEEETK